ncbi:MAG TPA: OmpH family outer membrane protein [Pirellulaceae bacterium]|nr:OmpH family outer membrane protein [Pirellulaceae bacterium]HMO92491.1 OmpH family outer membrane protein [Pirellulaceae bacterium]HMP69026.1 OmpH family outer membrane protein [Pirellulaceae bacterium]
MIRTVLYLGHGGLKLKSLVNKYRCLMLVAALVGTCTATANAQDGGFTVVLDVARVFKENTRFDSAMKSIQQEAEQVKVQVQGQLEALQAEAAKVIETFKQGTPEFQREETRLEQQQASLRTKARQLNEELLNKEAKLYHDTYLQMQQVVADLAEKHNIAMVLRFDSSKVDAENRADVIKAVNRGVVYQKELDITDMVIENMRSSTAAIMPNNR